MKLTIIHCLKITELTFQNGLFLMYFFKMNLNELS